MQTLTVPSHWQMRKPSTQEGGLGVACVEPTVRQGLVLGAPSAALAACPAWNQTLTFA